MRREPAALERRVFEQDLAAFRIRHRDERAMRLRLGERRGRQPRRGEEQAGQACCCRVGGGGDAEIAGRRHHDALDAEGKHGIERRRDVTILVGPRRVRALDLEP
jgi:hypothetical protein